MIIADLPTPAFVYKMGYRTPRYVYNRARQVLYERGHRDDPWLTPEAIRLLGPLLRPSDLGVEFGSGRSTTWFAERVAQLTSVEHDEQWYSLVAANLKARGMTNVNYILAPLDQPDELGNASSYVTAASAFSDGSLDFALIDGAYRDHTAKFVLPRIKSGGLLIIDNVNWYLPSHSRAPNSRTPALGPHGPVWAEVAGELAKWRTIWTSSGVWDTAMFIKP